MTSKPFLPDDKPKFWVVCVCAGLIGLAIGLMGFLTAVFVTEALVPFFAVAFGACWLVMAATGICFSIKLVGGSYTKVEALPWDKQVW